MNRSWPRWPTPGSFSSTALVRLERPRSFATWPTAKVDRERTSLFRAIKIAVDRNRAPGQFLLTGSANVLALPRLADALVGRMEIFTLWPLSEGERQGVREGFI